ncbi:hypothetical protein AOLI_G00231150 [Acnodon oligacanthus]
MRLKQSWRFGWQILFAGHVARAVPAAGRLTDTRDETWSACIGCVTRTNGRPLTLSVTREIQTSLWKICCPHHVDNMKYTRHVDKARASRTGSGLWLCVEEGV